MTSAAESLACEYYKRPSIPYVCANDIVRPRASARRRSASRSRNIQDYAEW